MRKIYYTTQYLILYFILRNVCDNIYDKMVYIDNGTYALIVLECFYQ